METFHLQFFTFSSVQKSLNSWGTGRSNLWKVVPVMGGSIDLGLSLQQYKGLLLGQRLVVCSLEGDPPVTGHDLCVGGLPAQILHDMEVPLDHLDNSSPPAAGLLVAGSREDLTRHNIK